MSDSLKAKRVQVEDKIYFQTLNGHIKDSLRILKTYFKKKDNVLNSFCKKWEIDETTFKKNLFLAIAFHDIGKLTKEFQNNIEVGKSSREYPHPFFALPILDKLPFDNFDDLPIPIFAILGHHVQLHSTIHDYVSKNVTYLKDEIFEFANRRAPKFYHDLKFEDDFDFPDISLKDWESMKLEDIKQNFIFRYSRQVDLGNYKTKAIFTYFFSLLQLCDDYSSANFRKFIEEKKPENTIYDAVLENPEEYVYDLEYAEDEFQKILFKGNTPYPFQNELVKNGDKFTFLFAPCGRGKTEAALWWAYRIKRTYYCDRIIFALPTQVTCNAMYKRFIDEYKFGEKNVGLFHGKSFITLKYRNQEVFLGDEVEESDEKTYDLLRDETFKGNVFLKPVTITTIDHLAYSLVHGFSQSDFATGNLQNSAIIFDEIHYYEIHTLNVLLRLFFILRKMKIPHLLMTGTAPEFLLKALNEKKEVYLVIKDNEGLKFQPFSIVKRDENILDNDSVFKEIKNDYLKSKKIFIILNQVEWAQNFYIDLKEYLRSYGIMPKMILYHSRFIYKDRVKKEKEIKEMVKQSPCIIAATQVIEISLNISSDVMYSQIAPPDAIGQRAGRLHRGGKFYNSYKMKLFSIEKYNPYPKEIVERSWINFSDGPLSYQSIKEICDKVYEDVRLEKDQRYNDFFKRNILFGNRPKEIATDDEGEALKIRGDNFQMVDVIPQKFEAELTEENNLLGEYKCRIPFYYIANDPSFFHPVENRFKEKVLFCSYPYSYELGLQRNNYDDIKDRIF